MESSQPKRIRDIISIWYPIITAVIALIVSWTVFNVRLDNVSASVSDIIPEITTIQEDHATFTQAISDIQSRLARIEHNQDLILEKIGSK